MAVGDRVDEQGRVSSLVSSRAYSPTDLAFVQLVNVLATLGEYPLIRYYNPPSNFHAPLGPASATGEHIGKALALRVQSEIDKYARDNSDFPVRLVLFSVWEKGRADGRDRKSVV